MIEIECTRCGSIMVVPDSVEIIAEFVYCQNCVGPP